MQNLINNAYDFLQARDQNGTEFELSIKHLESDLLKRFSK